MLLAGNHCNEVREILITAIGSYPWLPVVVTRGNRRVSVVTDCYRWLPDGIFGYRWLPVSTDGCQMVSLVTGVYRQLPVATGGLEEIKKL